MALFTFQQLNLESGFTSYSSGKSTVNLDNIFFRKNIEQVGIWFSELNLLRDWCVSTKKATYILIKID